MVKHADSEYKGKSKIKKILLLANKDYNFLKETKIPHYYSPTIMSNNMAYSALGAVTANSSFLHPKIYSDWNFEAVITET